MTIKERLGFATLTIAASIVGGAVSAHLFGASAVGAAGCTQDDHCAKVHAG